MKKQFLTLSLLIISLVSNAQTNTITFIADSSNTQRAYCSSYTNANNNTFSVFGPGVNNGGGFWADDLFKTDFSILPSNIIIDTAFLELSPDSNWNNVNPGGTEDNSVSVSLITSNWNQNVVNYSAEPSFSTINQITIPASISAFQFNRIDITNWVQMWVAQSSLNFGIKLSPINILGTSQRRYCWASSTNSNVNIRPKYKVYYHLIPAGFSNFDLQNIVISIVNNSIQIKNNSTTNINTIAISNALGQLIFTSDISISNNEMITLPITNSKLQNGLFNVQVSSINNGLLNQRIFITK